MFVRPYYFSRLLHKCPYMHVLQSVNISLLLTKVINNALTNNYSFCISCDIVLSVFAKHTQQGRLTTEGINFSVIACVVCCWLLGNYWLFTPYFKNWVFTWTTPYQIRRPTRTPSLVVRLRRSPDTRFEIFFGLCHSKGTFSEFVRNRFHFFVFAIQNFHAY